MMRKSFRAFTLIELIIAMALMGMILACAMRFFVPVNDMHKDLSSKERIMAITNGVSRYVGESVRYSKYVMIYVGYNSPPSNLDVLTDFRGLDPEKLLESKIDNDTLSAKIKGLYLNNSTPVTYSGKAYKGRVYKLKSLKDGTPKMALTPSYYGRNSLFFSIPIGDDGKPQITAATMEFNIQLLNQDNSAYSSTDNEIDFLNMNSRIEGQMDYKVGTGENIYVYYYEQ